MSFLLADSVEALRRKMRALRRALSPAQRQQAALQLAAQVAALPLFSDAQHLAGYLAVDGELDPEPLLTQARRLGKQVYLPVLTERPETPLLFAPSQPDSLFKPNRFGIPEPQVPFEALVPAQRLDLVLTPLVAFDTRGNRLGMGGGYYDRTFAFRRAPNPRLSPHLLGLAYELQKLAELTAQPWDIPLDGIATERAFYPGATAP